MARGGGAFDLIALGAIGYVSYKLALLGKLGPSAQRTAFDLREALTGEKAPQPSAGDCQNPFIPGVQYVARLPDGRFEVVVGGSRRGVFNTQEEAEAEYNRLTCKREL